MCARVSLWVRVLVWVCTMTVDVDDVSVWRLMGINGAAFGHEVSACVAYTYVPPLLLKAGFSETAMTVTMGIGKSPISNPKNADVGVVLRCPSNLT